MGIIALAVLCGFTTAWALFSTREWRAARADAERAVETERRVRAAHERQLETWKQLALIDGLTGLFNARGAEIELRRIVAGVLRSTGYVTAFIVDMNRLKHVNDTFGHGAGSVAIALLGGVLRETLVRDGDVGCRQGGDEFMMILPGTGRSGAAKVAERVRGGLAAADFRPDSANRFELSASIGGATLCVTKDAATLGARSWNLNERRGSALVDEVVDALKRSADVAMYRAKQKAHGDPLGITTAVSFGDEAEAE